MTTTAAVKLVSTLAQFVQGDIKGGAHAHAFRTSVIQSAIEQAYKGNYSPITEAATLTEGKAKKTRAYAAGFAALGVVGTDLVKVAYIGKLDSSANKEARDSIQSKTHHSTIAFFAAFDAVMAEKAAPKAAKAPAAPAPVAETEADTDAESAPIVVASQHDAAVAIDDAVQTMLRLLSNGMLTGAQLDDLGDAIRAAEGRALLAQRTEDAVSAAGEAWLAGLTAEQEAQTCQPGGLTDPVLVAQLRSMEAAARATVLA